MNLKLMSLVCAVLVSTAAAPVQAADPEYDATGLKQTPFDPDRDHATRRVINKLKNFIDATYEKPENVPWMQAAATGASKMWGNMQQADTVQLSRAMLLVGDQCDDGYAADLLKLPESAGRTEAAILYLHAAAQYLEKTREIQKRVHRLNSTDDNGNWARTFEVAIRSQGAKILELEIPNILDWLEAEVDARNDAGLRRRVAVCADKDSRWLVGVIHSLYLSGDWCFHGWETPLRNELHEAVCSGLARIATRVLYVEQKYGGPGAQPTLFQASNMGMLIGSYQAAVKRANKDQFKALEETEATRRIVVRIVTAGLTRGAASFLPLPSWEDLKMKELGQIVSPTVDGGIDEVVQGAGERTGGGAEAFITEANNKEHANAHTFKKLLRQLLRTNAEHNEPEHDAWNAWMMFETLNLKPGK